MKVPEVFKLPIHDQIADLVQSVYALEETHDEIKFRSSHIIAHGEVSHELTKALAVLHASLSYTVSIAEFIEKETKGENPRTIRRTDLNGEYDHLWTDDLEAMPVSYVPRVDALFKALNDLNRVPVPVQATRLVWARVSFRRDGAEGWVASAEPAIKTKHWSAEKALHLVQALDAFNRGETP